MKALLICAGLASTAVASSLRPNVDNNVFNVRTYGAVGDGIHNDTSAIQATIDAASAAPYSTVLLPAGNYSSWPLLFESVSSMVLQFEAAALITAAPMSGWPTNPKQWPYGGCFLCYNGGSNVSIVGAGVCNVCCAFFLLLASMSKGAFSEGGWRALADFGLALAGTPTAHPSSQPTLPACCVAVVVATYRVQAYPCCRLCLCLRAVCAVHVCVLLPQRVLPPPAVVCPADRHRQPQSPSAIMTTSHHIAPSRRQIRAGVRRAGRAVVGSLQVRSASTSMGYTWSCSLLGCALRRVQPVSEVSPSLSTVLPLLQGQQDCSAAHVLELYEHGGR